MAEVCGWIKKVEGVRQELEDTGEEDSGGRPILRCGVSAGGYCAWLKGMHGCLVNFGGENAIPSNLRPDRMATVVYRAG